VLTSVDPERGAALTQTLWDRIETARERWNVLRHPFYRRWSAGELSRSDLARYAGQYRHAVRAIADASESVAAGAPEHPELRVHAEEEREHVALWDGFVFAAGGSPTDPATPETTECVRAWVGREDLLDGLVTLYAVESGQPDISRTKLEGLVGTYGFADGDGTAYFHVHEALDTQHAAEARRLIDGLAGERDTDRLAAVAEGAFRANWRLLDGA
jgi:pyrroloquinoline-quinone synthase